MRVADEICYPMFLLLPWNLCISDLDNGMVEFQSSGNLRFWLIKEVLQFIEFHHS
jgi:hypothetical protein